MTNITIGLPNSTPSFANSDVAVAQTEGYFAQEGLNVKVDNLSSGVPVVQGVVGPGGPLIARHARHGDGISDIALQGLSIDLQGQSLADVI